MAPNNNLKHLIRSSPFGRIAIVWQEVHGQPSVQRVFLPAKDMPEELGRAFPASQRGRHPTITELASLMMSFLNGTDVTFSLEWIALRNCSLFQRRVLRAEHRIPRGCVSTYGRIAKHLGIPAGGRAVGRALATNPFPIIIPCHRAIRNGGALGGYQGGIDMKRALLEYEGLAISDHDRVLRPKYFYSSPPRCS